MQLLAYQKDILKQIRQKRANCILAMSMGLGKTVITSYIIQKFYEHNSNIRILIICPPILYQNWIEHINKWTDVKNIQIIDTSNCIINHNCNVTIVSYNIFNSVYFDIPAPDLLILDESHFIKNFNAKRTKSIIDFVNTHKDIIKYKILLTGTPILNKPLDLFPQLHILNSEKFNSYIEFTRKYFISEQKIAPNGGRYTYYYVNPQLRQELKKLIEPYIIRFTWDMLRRYKIAIPKLIQIPFVVTDANYTVKKLQDDKNKKETLPQLRMYCARLKMKWVVDYIKDNIDTMQKCIVFVWHREIANEIDEILNKNRVKSVMLIGGETNQKKQRILNNFRNGSIQVLIANMLTTGFGLNLEFCKYCIFLEYDFSPANITQCFHRIFRITSNEPVKIILPYVKGSFEEHIINVLVRKQKEHDYFVGIDNIDRIRIRKEKENEN